MKPIRVILTLMVLVSLLSAAAVLVQAKTDTYSFSVGANFGDRNEFNFEVKTVGTIRLEATWSGSVPLALILNGPGQVGYYDRKDGNSPLVITYQVTQEILNRGTAWKATITNFSKTTGVNGTIRIEYPTPAIVVVLQTGQLGQVVQILPQTFNTFDRLAVVSVAKTPNNATFTVDYTLATQHARDVFMGAGIMNADKELSWFGFGPARINAGSGRAQVEVSYRYNNPPAITTTDQIVVYLYEGGQKPFCKAINDLRLNWNK